MLILYSLGRVMVRNYDNGLYYLFLNILNLDLVDCWRSFLRGEWKIKGLLVLQITFLLLFSFTFKRGISPFLRITLIFLFDSLVIMDVYRRFSFKRIILLLFLLRGKIYGLGNTFLNILLFILSRLLIGNLVVLTTVYFMVDQILPSFRDLYW